MKNYMFMFMFLNWWKQEPEINEKLNPNTTQENISFVSDNIFYLFVGQRLPRQFCNLHFPTSENTILVLEDENGKHYKTKYLPHCGSLSGGWKRFSVSKNLQEDDVLVFHLVQPCKFKVYILRTTDYDPVDKDHTIPKTRDFNLDTKKASKNPKRHPPVVETNTTTESHNLPADIMFSKTISSFKNFKITMENQDSLPDDRFSKNISSFKNFKIVVDNKTIDCEIPKHIRNSYCVLCRTRKTSLHRHLIKRIDHKLAASIISETMNIADAITNSNMSIPRDDIAYWNTPLQSFEFIGMDVGFIRARLNRLLGITRECSNAVTDWKKNKKSEDESEVVRIEEEMREFENKIEDLQILNGGVEWGNRVSMGEIAEKFKVMYTEEAKAPW